MGWYVMVSGVLTSRVKGKAGQEEDHMADMAFGDNIFILSVEQA